MTRSEKKERAKAGWFNWYVNRNRMPLANCSDSDLRRAARSVSWRRAF